MDPYAGGIDFPKPKHLYSRKTLVRCAKTWPSIRQALRSNVDVAITLFRNGSWSPRVCAGGSERGSTYTATSGPSRQLALASVGRVYVKPLAGSGVSAGC